MARNIFKGIMLFVLIATLFCSYIIKDTCADYLTDDPTIRKYMWYGDYNGTPTKIKVDSDGVVQTTGGGTGTCLWTDTSDGVYLDGDATVSGYVGGEEPYRTESRVITSDTTITDSEGGFVGIDTSGGDITITMADISSFSGTGVDEVTFFKTAEDNIVTFELAVPTQTLSDYSTMKIRRKGFGIRVVRNREQDKYWFTPVGANTSLELPAVATGNPSLSATTLSMNGELNDMASNSSVDVYFQYREEGTTSWTTTTAQTKTSIGSFSDTATVTAGLVYEVRAVAEISDGSLTYGAILDTGNNYYSDMDSATDDGLIRYWALQETSGTNTDCEESVENDTANAYNGLTIGSDAINGNTIYKRIFGTSDYTEASLILDRQGTYTILIQIDMNSISGDHTIFNNGANFLSLASDGTGIQLESGTQIQTWSSATPFSSILNLFVTYDYNNSVARLYETTSSTDTLRITNYNMPSNNASYFRVGRGSSGDANHQDDEYMDDGEVRSIAIWDRELSSAERKSIADKLDNDGGLIVSDTSYTPIPSEHGVNASIVNHRDVNDDVINNISDKHLLVWDSSNNEFVDESTVNGVDITGDLTVDGNTLYIDSTNNRVGIGTTSPTSELEVSGDVDVSDSLTANAVFCTELNFTGGSDLNINSDTKITGDLTVTGHISGGTRILSKSADYTLTEEEMYNTIVYVTSACTITLPQLSTIDYPENISVSIVTIGAVAVNVDPNASDKILLDGTTLDDGDKITNTSTAGDMAVINYYSTDGFYASTNSWTDGGV